MLRRHFVHKSGLLAHLEAKVHLVLVDLWHSVQIQFPASIPPAARFAVAVIAGGRAGRVRVAPLEAVRVPRPVYRLVVRPVGRTLVTVLLPVIVRPEAGVEEVEEAEVEAGQHVRKADHTTEGGRPVPVLLPPRPGRSTMTVRPEASRQPIVWATFRHVRRW